LKPTNDTLLKSIADSSGGKYQITAADVFGPTGRTAPPPDAALALAGHCGGACCSCSTSHCGVSI